MKKFWKILVVTAIISLFLGACDKQEDIPPEEDDDETEVVIDNVPSFVKGRENLVSGHYYIEKNGDIFGKNDSGEVSYSYKYEPEMDVDVSLNEDGGIHVVSESKGSAFVREGIMNVTAPEERIYYEGYINDASVTNPAEYGVSNNKVLFFNEDINKIPTLYVGDRIIYNYSQGVQEEFVLERYEDMGYSVGICGLGSLSSGRYYLNTEYDEDASIFRICEWSDADELYYSETAGFVIDTIGGEPLRNNSGYVTRCGTIRGLEKDGKYLFNMYIGTHLEQHILTANVRMLASWTAINLNEYDFLECNIATFTIPDYIEDGYYTINGSGVFKICRKISEDATEEEKQQHDMNVPITFPSNVVVEASEDSEYAYEGNTIQVGNISYEAGVTPDEALLRSVYDGYGEYFTCRYLGAVETETEYILEYEKLYSGYAIELVPEISVWYLKNGRLKEYPIESTLNSYSFTRKPEDGDCIMVMSYFENTNYTLTTETAPQNEEQTNSVKKTDGDINTDANVETEPENTEEANTDE